LVENYLPNALQKYGMDYKTVSGINPSIIYASITGYGQTGPYSNRAGYDVMVEAEMGLMHITGSRDGPPVKVGVAITDLTTGLYTSNSIMAALIGRVKTGKGQHIDVSLTDCQVASLANIASSTLISGQKDSGRWGTAHRKELPCLIKWPPTDDNSFHRPIQRLQNSRWGHLARRRKRSPLRSSLCEAGKVRMGARFKIHNQQRSSKEPKCS
jgi:crotonobetainyl-CoA:carnitine CoA-transferase CaiB-like acyl-CoA transferase